MRREKKIMLDDGAQEFFQLCSSGGSAREESSCIDPSPLYSNKGRFEQISHSMSGGIHPFHPPSLLLFISPLF